MSTGLTLYAHVQPNATKLADGADLISSNWNMMFSVRGRRSHKQETAAVMACQTI